MEWKEHVAWIAPFLATAVAFTILYYGAQLVRRGELRFSKNYGLGSGVGPLSGKVTVAVIAYIVSWAILAYLWRGKEVTFGRIFTISLVLVVLGFLFTFPPLFLAFESKG